VKCKDCGIVLEVYVPEGHIITDDVRLKVKPDEYVCDDCTFQRGTEDGPMHFMVERDGGRSFGADTLVLEEWRPVMYECASCGVQLWGMKFRFTADRELLDGDLNRMVYPAGTVAEFVECPNPGCEMAWGTSGHHDNINLRYSWMRPPWVLEIKVEERFRNPRDLRRAQRRANKKWWSKHQREESRR